eukprot:1082399-Pleurochrysis_carterae.AAC.1
MQQQMYHIPQTPVLGAHAMHGGAAQQHQSPPTPLSVELVREQLRLARNQQSMESNPEMMRQRSLYIMDLEAKLAQHRHERSARRYR